jgi:hypothetical protein
MLASTLWGHAMAAVGLDDGEELTSADLARIGARYRELLAEWEFDMATRDALRRAEEATAKAVRQEQRRQEFARRRAMPRADRRAPNKPVRIDVDPEVWEVVKRRALQGPVWFPAVDAVGMKGFHGLRHTNATLAAASDAPLAALMARLGHASAAAAIWYQHRMEG